VIWGRLPGEEYGKKDSIHVAHVWLNRNRRIREDQRRMTDDNLAKALGDTLHFLLYTPNRQSRV